MFRKETLSNGLTVLTEQLPHVRSVAIGVWLRRGSRHETEDESGLAHFIEHMLFKGTESRTQLQIAQEMDSIGGQTDAFTSQEYAGFHAKVVDEHVGRAVDLLSDIVLNPRFEPVELARPRRVIFEEIKSVEDAPEELVHDIFVEDFWPRHPLGRPILGHPETVRNFTRRDLLSFFRKTYAPSNMIVSAAGNIEHERLRDLVAERFDSLSTPPDGVIDTPPLVSARIRVLDKDLELAHLLIGSVCPEQASPRRYAAYVLNAVLGGNMSSRLFQVIREERGLAYSVYSGLMTFRDAGQFSVYAGTDPKNVTEVVDLMLNELRLIKAEPVTQSELRRAKDHLRGSILMGGEGTGSRMSQIARQEMYFGRLVPIEEAIEGIESVDAEQVQSLAIDMFERRALSMTLLGRIDQLEPMPETLVA
jgi:predicted Zn-dependent peptidase